MAGRRFDNLTADQRRLTWLLWLERARPLLDAFAGVATHLTAFGIERWGAAAHVLDAWWAELLDGVLVTADQRQRHWQITLFLAQQNPMFPDWRWDALSPLLCDINMLACRRKRIAPFDAVDSWDLQSAVGELTEMESAIDPSCTTEPSYIAEYIERARAIDLRDTAGVNAARGAKFQASEDGRRRWASLPELLALRIR